MVYCGVPSKGCRCCRKRRIKCDQRPLGCSQCAKASMDCPGYRNQLDLIFRDESDHVVRKAQKMSKPSQAHTTSNAQHKVSRDKLMSCSKRAFQCAHDPGDKEGPGRTDFTPMAKEAFMMLDSLSYPVQDQAIGFLLNSYVKESYFDYLPELCATIHVDDALLKSVQAVGLASLSCEMKCADVLALATSQYIAALRLTNAALQSGTESTKDSTLVSILLLSLFETIVCKDHTSIAPWTSHIEGAAALLILRGPRQFENSTGQRLFKQVNNYVRISAIQRKMRIPPAFKAFRASVADRIDNNDFVSRFGAVSELFSELRASLNEGSISEPALIIDMAKDLDDQMVSLIRSAPKEWDFETISIPNEVAAVYGNHFHLYRRQYIAKMWNSIRMTRIMLNEIVRIHISRESSLDKMIPSSWVHLLSQSQRNGREMAAEICASAPQYTQCPVSSPSARVVANGYLLIWPLSIAGEYSLSPEPLRAYVIDRLRFIGNDMNIPQALDIAQNIEDGKRLDYRVNVREAQKMESAGRDIAASRAYLYHTF